MAQRFTIKDLIKKGLVADSNGIWSKQSTKAIKARKIEGKGVNKASVPVRINIKPLSVNQAFRGRRFTSPKYKVFQDAVTAALPHITLPDPPFAIYFKFGFSSKTSDWDNCIKTAQDCLAKHYKFNDKLIRKGEVHTEIVKKGQEYFVFHITTFIE